MKVIHDKDEYWLDFYLTEDPNSKYFLTADLILFQFAVEFIWKADYL